MVRTAAVSIALLPLVLGLASGCAVGDDGASLCAAASEHAAGCLGLAPASDGPGCDQATARTVLEASCEELLTGSGKADSFGDLRALLCNLGDVEYCTACPLRSKGLWVWTDEVVLDSGARRALFDFAASREVGTLYVNAEALVTTGPAALDDFVTAAAVECLETELLLGAPDWALAGHHDVPLTIAREAAGLRAAGLHFDVEPYLLAEWALDPEGVANQYLDLLEELGPLVRDAGMRLTVDSPFWFDEQLVGRSGSSRPLSEWVADRVDRVVLMDYRDEIAGSDGIVAHAANEVAYASGSGRELVVGVETACGQLPKTTFCEEGAASLDAALEATEAAFAAEPGFAGVAVHHYAAYQAL